MIELPALHQKIIWEARQAKAEAAAMKREANELGKAFERIEERVGEADERMARHRRTVRETRTDHDRLGRATEGMANAFLRASERIRITETRIRAHLGTVRRAKRDHDALGEAAGGAGRGLLRLGAGADAASESFGRLSTGLLVSLLKIPAVLVGVNLVIHLLSSLSAAVVALAGSLGPLVGLLAAAGPMVTSFGQAALAGVLGVSGMKNALQALTEAASGAPGSIEKLRAAMAGLGPEAQALAREAVSAVGRLGAIKAVATEGLARGLRESLGGGVGGLVDVLVGPLRRIAALASEALGRSLGRILDALVRPQVLDDLGKGALVNASLLNTFTDAAIALIDVLRNLMAAASPLAMVLGDLFRTWAEGLARTTAEARQSGRLANFFADAFEQGRLFGRILRDLLVGLKNLLGAGRILGDRLWGDAAAGIARWREWTASLEGRSRLQAWFLEAEPAVREVFRLIKDVFDVFVRSTGNLADASVAVVGALRTKLLPVLEELLRTVSGGFAQRLVDLIVTIAKTFQLLAGESAGLNAFLRTMRGILGTINALLENVPGLRQLVFLVLTLGTASKLFSAIGATMRHGLQLPVKIVDQLSVGFAVLTSRAGQFLRVLAGLSPAVRAARAAAATTDVLTTASQAVPEAVAATLPLQAASTAAQAGSALAGMSRGAAAASLAMRGLGVAAAGLSVAGPVIAGVLTGITAVQAGLALWRERAEKAKRATEELAQAIASGRLKDALASMISEEKVTKAIKRIGVSPKELADAIVDPKLGRELKARLEREKKSLEAELADVQLALNVAMHTGRPTEELFALRDRIEALKGDIAARKTAISTIEKQGAAMQKAMGRAKELNAAEDAAAAATRRRTTTIEEQRRALERKAAAELEATNAAFDAASRASAADDAARQAAEQLAQARKEADRAIRDARRRAEDAAERVRDAELRLRDAQREALRAQEELNRARHEAAEHLEDLRFAAEGAALSEKRAAESLRQARKELARAALEGDADRTREAALSVAEADLALRQAIDRRQDTAEELARAEAKGIEGSDILDERRRAAERAQIELERARRDLPRARDEYRQALEEAAGVREETARRIRDAERALKDAIVEAARTAVEAEEERRKAAGEAALTVKEKIDLQIRKINELTAALAPGSAARRALDEYVAKLKEISNRIETKVVVDAGNAIDTIQNLIGLYQQTAALIAPFAPPFAAAIMQSAAVIQAVLDRLRIERRGVPVTSTQKLVATGGVLVGDRLFFAAGGVPAAVVADGFVTSGARAIVGEGNPAWPEFVIPTDPTHRDRALALFAELARWLGAGGDLGDLVRQQNAALRRLASGGTVGATRTVPAGIDRRISIEQLVVHAEREADAVGIGREIAWGLRMMGA
jgi:hypothetical protein